MSEDNRIERRKLTEFMPDDDNPNRGTERGAYMIGHSVEQVGAGRSLVADKNNKIVSGNKTQEQLISAGIEDAIVVHTKGKEIVIVQRDDFDLDDPDPNNPARRYSVLDNRSSEVSLEWDGETVERMIEAGFDFSPMFMEFELDAITNAPAPEEMNMGDFEAPSDTDIAYRVIVNGLNLERATELEETLLEDYTEVRVEQYRVSQ